MPLSPKSNPFVSITKIEQVLKLLCSWDPNTDSPINPKRFSCHDVTTYRLIWFFKFFFTFLTRLIGCNCFATVSIESFDFLVVLQIFFSRTRFLHQNPVFLLHPNFAWFFCLSLDSNSFFIVNSGFIFATKFAMEITPVFYLYN